MRLYDTSLLLSVLAHLCCSPDVHTPDFLILFYIVFSYFWLPTSSPFPFDVAVQCRDVSCWLGSCHQQWPQSIQCVWHWQRWRHWWWHWCWGLRMETASRRRFPLSSMSLAVLRNTRWDAMLLVIGVVWLWHRMHSVLHTCWILLCQIFSTHPVFV